MGNTASSSAPKPKKGARVAPEPSNGPGQGARVAAMLEEAGGAGRAAIKQGDEHGAALRLQAKAVHDQADAMEKALYEDTKVAACARAQRQRRTRLSLRFLSSFPS